MLKALSFSRSSLLQKFHQPVYAILGDPAINFDLLFSPEYEANLNHRKNITVNLSELRQLYREKDKNVSSKVSLYRAAVQFPNISNHRTPIGADSQAQIISQHGEKKVFSNFNPLLAAQLCNNLHLLRLKNVAYSNGDRTYFFLGRLALLERALIRYTTEQLLKSRFQLVSVPDTFNSEVIEACGFQTQGKRHQIYKIENLYSKDSPYEHCLSGTSEIGLGGLCAYRSFPTANLPVKLCAVSRCYRREVPRHEPELYRVNQFSKVEMFCLASGNQTASDAMFDEIIEIQKSIFTSLDLHFRVIEMPTEELGLPAHRKIDIEVWMPGEKRFGEVSSTSNCTDFQSRRLHIKETNESQESELFVHTLNGTACAIPRMIKAIVETHQDKKGRINLPKVLWPYMNGRETLQKLYPPVKVTYIERPYSSIRDSSVL